MSRMIAGQWVSEDDIRAGRDGAWKRTPSVLRNWVTPDGAPGPSREGGFAAEPGRYHLYVARNCPWAHRTLLTRVLKGLESHIDISVAAPERTDQGWVFDPANGYRDELFASQSLYEIYSRGEKEYTGRVTVPVLWDKKQNRIVSNESADIVRMLGSAFDNVGANARDLYPEELRGEIDTWNAQIYPGLNNGVYRAGFAESQAAYEEAAWQVFETLDMIEERLGTSRYLAGDCLTEADIRLFPTLARFDVAYVSAFRCNLRRLVDYPRLWDYARHVYHVPGVAGTVFFDIYRRGYHSRSEKRNPLGIIPIGPRIDWGSASDYKAPCFRMNGVAPASVTSAA